MNQPAENETPAPQPNGGATENFVKEFSVELNMPQWSVVSFEKRVAESLTYQQATEKLNELLTEKVSGLCIITDEAAERIGN